MTNALEHFLNYFPEYLVFRNIPGILGGFLSPINLHSLETLLILGMTTKKWKKGHCCEFTSVFNFECILAFFRNGIWLFFLVSQSLKVGKTEIYRYPLTMAGKAWQLSSKTS